MVFVHRAATAEMVTAKLAHHRILVADLHAAADKRDRKRAMDDFRSGEVPVLIASDVAARGLDVKGVTHVFNLDVPTQSKAYLHRVGRTARAGAKGQAVTLMSRDELRLADRYERELGIVMRRMRLREGRVLDAEEADRGGEGAVARGRTDQPVRPATKRR
jgi:superfamily II DNA/RNA helicase